MNTSKEDESSSETADLARGAMKVLATLNGGAPKSKLYKQLQLELASRITIAETVFKARQAKGLNQGELARKAKLKQSRVSEVESMRGNATVETLDRIARVLDLQINLTPRMKLSKSYLLKKARKGATAGR